VAKLTALQPTGFGTLTGVVTLNGDLPTPKPLAVVGQDHDHCPKSMTDPTWIVDAKSRGVANVVVWLEPPAGSCFPMPAKDRTTWPTEVIVRQPHCAFEPHVVVLFPRVYNPETGKTVPTGQVLKVVNDASIVHSIRLEGDPSRNPRQDDVLLALKPGGKPSTTEFKQIQPDPAPLTLRCGLHPWMSGFARAFDHPYAAVTGPDGRFEIAHVPAGVELRVRGWHESGRTVQVAPADRVTIPVDGTTQMELSVTP
jgi:hypothetical protein